MQAASLIRASAVVLAALLALHAPAAAGEGWSYQPQQVHLAYGSNCSQMSVTWTTVADTPSSLVEYGLMQGGGKLSQHAEGFSTNFSRPTNPSYIHRAVLTELQCGAQYVYHVGSSSGWSDVFAFTAQPPPSPAYRYTFAVYGDLGDTNSRALGLVQEAAAQGEIDAVIHNGDFAYDLNSQDGRVGDAFMRDIESIASSTPYQTSVGNHESFQGSLNASDYRNRFTMPNWKETQNLYYSWDAGYVHFVAVSSEVYFYMPEALQSQWNFLVEDLARANENRAATPHIVVYIHRPLYCSATNNNWCARPTNPVRVGLNVSGELQYGLEELFFDQGVTLIIGAHEHYYERLLPVYNYKVMNGSTTEPYTDAPAPTQLIVGSAGCSEGVSPLPNGNSSQPIPDWSAFRTDEYGYGQLTVLNETTLNWKWISQTEGGRVEDEINIVNTKLKRIL